MKILFIGDIFGTTGKRVVAERLPAIIEERSIDVCIANAENIAGGRGITHNLLKKLHKFGVRIITGGNHSLACPDSYDDFAADPFLLRPLNMPPGNVGHGTALFSLPDGRVLGVISLLGRTFFQEQFDCPFRSAVAAINEMTAATRCIIVDFHAEATSEKKAMAQYLDGRVSAVLGTHTHVQTADESVSEKGTASITDVGMTGPEESVIGMKKDAVVKRFLLQTHVRFEPAAGRPMLNAVALEIDDATGRSLSIARIYERITFP
ncbi:MAG: TIGR00282 family metallophosphoesterase [Chitinivibrionales bacterium]